MRRTDRCPSRSQKLGAEGRRIGSKRGTGKKNSGERTIPWPVLASGAMSRSADDTLDDTLEAIDWAALEAAARAARERAHAPYSRFLVGAAILTDDGTVVAGCNVENRSYGLSICAERTAVVRAVAAGLLDRDRPLRAVLVVTDTAPPASPCGMCRETLREFGDESLPVRLANLAGEHVEHTLGALHPHAFEFDGPIEEGERLPA